MVPNSKDVLEIAAGDKESFGFNEKEMGTAKWVFDHAEAAGSGTQTLNGSLGLYIPLRGIQTTVGVLGIRSPWSGSLDPDRERLLDTFASEIGGALESTRMTEMAGRAEAEVETERLRNMILRTFSIDVTEPLERIEARIKNILSGKEPLPESVKKEIQNIEREASRLRKISIELPSILSMEDNKTEGNPSGKIVA